MKTVYRIKGYIAHSQKDNWENGCQLEGGKTEFGKGFTLQSESLRGLMDDLKAEFRAESDECFLLDSCDEDGRLDLQVMQREPFTIGKPSEATISKWKAGEIDLWLTDYSFQIERVQSDFSLTEALEAETK